MTIKKQHLIPVAIGLITAACGFSAAWTAGYESAQRSAYNQTLAGLLSLARSTDQIVFAREVSDFGARIGRRSDFLQYSLDHPGTYKPPASVIDPNWYKSQLAEQLKEYRLTHPKMPVK